MPEVLIVGAGPTGLVLALELALRGVRVRIVDKAAGPGTASRAMAVQARTLELYRRLGLAEEVVARGIAVRRVHLRKQGIEVARVDVGDFGSGLSPYPFVLTFPQDEHETVLGERLRREGVEVEWQTELLSFDDAGSSVRFTVRRNGSEEQGEASWLCGTDGAHSVVREGLGIGFPGGTYEQTFYVADVEASGVATDGDLNICLGTDLLCVVFPIRTSGTFRLIGIVPADVRERPQLEFDDLRSFIEGLVGIRIGTERWFSTYRVHHRVADRFRAGRAFLAGDAGHVHSPAGGQGMNTGIGDAVNLGWKLAEVVKGRSPASILETYEPERIAFARTLVATTDTAFTGLVDPNLRGRAIRNVLVPFVVPRLVRFDAFRRLAFRTLSQTRVHYRESALSSGAAGSLRGGDRLPWVERLDNFAPLRSLDWQLHVYGDATTELRRWTSEAQIALHTFEWCDEAAATGLVRDAAYLVRPDSYVAAISADAGLGEVRATLKRFRL